MTCVQAPSRTCANEGDSGGGYVTQMDNSRWNVVAIASHGDLTCRMPAFVTDVHKFLPWIKAGITSGFMDGNKYGVINPFSILLQGNEVMVSGLHYGKLMDIGSEMDPNAFNRIEAAGRFMTAEFLDLSKPSNR